jgi:hypothetical protein
MAVLRTVVLAGVCLSALMMCGGVSGTTSFLSLGDWGDVTTAQGNVIQAMVSGCGCGCAEHIPLFALQHNHSHTHHFVMVCNRSQH